MTELDFLPEWYRVCQQRRRSYFVFVWLGACLLGVMGLWLHASHSRIRQARADVQAVERDHDALKERLAKGDQLRAVRDETRRKSEITRLLTGCPDMIHVLRRLVELMPPEVALTALDVSSQVIKDEAVPPPPARAGRSGSSVSGSVAKYERRRYALRITGLAPFDELVANMVTRLADSDAFTNVQIVYTKDVRRHGKIMRQFELTCQLVDQWEAIDARQAGGHDGGLVIGVEIGSAEGLEQ